VSAPDICERAKKGRQASGLEDKNKGKGKLDRGRTQIQEAPVPWKTWTHESLASTVLYAFGYLYIISMRTWECHSCMNSTKVGIGWVKWACFALLDLFPTLISFDLLIDLREKDIFSQLNIQKEE